MWVWIKNNKTREEKSKHPDKTWNKKQNKTKQKEKKSRQKELKIKHTTFETKQCF